MLSPLPGEPNLQAALEEAKRAFDQAPSRPNAEKVLVVIMDKKSSNEHKDVAKALKPLKKDKVKVVPVAIGPDADVDELRNITSAKDYLVEVAKKEDPKKVAEKIMEKVSTGSYAFVVMITNVVRSVESL